jgi:mevalonate pyrophosphate decarboxylase
MIILANAEKKKVPSTEGMASSVETSELINLRNEIANKRIELILNCLNRIEKEGQ